MGAASGPAANSAVAAPFAGRLEASWRRKSPVLRRFLRWHGVCSASGGRAASRPFGGSFCDVLCSWSCIGRDERAVVADIIRFLVRHDRHSEPGLVRHRLCNAGDNHDIVDRFHCEFDRQRIQQFHLAVNHERAAGCPKPGFHVNVQRSHERIGRAAGSVLADQQQRRR